MIKQKNKGIIKKRPLKKKIEKKKKKINLELKLKPKKNEKITEKKLLEKMKLKNFKWNKFYTRYVLNNLKFLTEKSENKIKWKGIYNPETYDLAGDYAKKLFKNSIKDYIYQVCFFKQKNPKAEEYLHRACANFIKNKYSNLIGITTFVGHGQPMRYTDNGYIAGFPDYSIYEPKGGYHGLLIEFKTPNGKIKKNQLKMAKELNRKGYLSVIVKSYHEFICLIHYYMNLKSSRKNKMKPKIIDFIIERQKKT